MKSEQRRMLKEGRIEGVIRELEAELESNTSDVSVKEDLVLAALAYASSHRQRSRDAIHLYEGILQYVPDEPHILVNLGFNYMGIDDGKAIELFDKVCQRAKKEPTDREVLSLALTNLGAIYEKFTYYETAHDRYTIALHICPENQLAAKYLKQLEELADPDHGPIGLRKLANGTETPMLWDGSYFRGRTRSIDISDIKLK